MTKCGKIFSSGGGTGYKLWRCQLPEGHEGGHNAQGSASIEQTETALGKITKAEDAPAAIVKGKDRRNPEMLERRRAGYGVPRFLNRRRNRGRRGNDLIS